MESLPDLATLSDDDLKTLIDRLTEEENEVSFRRRAVTIISLPVEICASSDAELCELTAEPVAFVCAEAGVARAESANTWRLPKASFVLITLSLSNIRRPYLATLSARHPR